MESFAERSSRAEAADGPGPLAMSLRWLAIVTMAFSLNACGGGGGGGDAATPGSPPPTPPAPTPAPSPSQPALIAAQLSVPTPVGYDADRLAAFNRLNEIRLSAGLGMVAQQSQMDQAAQAHADWMIANDAFTHEEQAGTPGFTGVNFSERDEFFGYVPVGGGEVMSAGASAADGIDVLVNGVYHRSVVLALESVDVGIGWSSQTATELSRPLVVDLTKPGTDTTRGLGQAAQDSIHGVEIWPLDGALGVPVRLGLESPDPVPSQDVLTLGTPASLTVEASKTIHANSFVMTKTVTGDIVAAQVLTNQNDPNFLIPESFIAIVPLVVLAPNTSYSVAFSGYTVEFPTGATELVNRAWSFTTAAQ